MTHAVHNAHFAERLLDHSSQRRDLFLRFEPGADHLHDGDDTVLRLWGQRWAQTDPSRQVVMACHGGRSRALRVRRLEEIASTLAQCGVPRERIRYTADRVEAAHDVPALDAVSLRSIGAAPANASVRSIASFFAGVADEQRKEQACTSAS